MGIILSTVLSLQTLLLWGQSFPSLNEFRWLNSVLFVLCIWQSSFWSLEAYVPGWRTQHGRHAGRICISHWNRHYGKGSRQFASYTCCYLFCCYSHVTPTAIWCEVTSLWILGGERENAHYPSPWMRLILLYDLMTEETGLRLTRGRNSFIILQESPVKAEKTTLANRTFLSKGKPEDNLSEIRYGPGDGGSRSSHISCSSHKRPLSCTL